MSKSSKASLDPSHGGLLAEHNRSMLKVGNPLHGSTGNVSWSGSWAGSLHNVKAKPSGLLEDGGAGSRRVINSGGLPAPEGRLTPTLAIAALVAMFGSSVPHGWNTGVMNMPAPLIKSFLNETYMLRTGSAPDELTLEVLWSTSVALYLFGGMFGAFSSGAIANWLGRKKGLLFIHIFCISAAVLFSLCQVAMSFEMLFIARAVAGFGCGAGCGLVPMYLVEIAPVNIRGAMGVLHQFGLTMGILLSNVFGLRQLMGTQALWPHLMAMMAAPCLVCAIILPFYPESPRFLLCNKDNRKEAEKAMRRFRGLEDVSADIEEIRLEHEQQALDPKWTFRELLASKHLRLPLLLVCSMASAQQLSGINVVFYYSGEVFETAGVPLDMIQYAILAIGAFNVLMTGISVPLMEKAGRRLLLLGGMLIMMISSCIITAALITQEFWSWMAYVSLACIITTVLGFAVGLGPIPHFIPAELFKTGPRPPAMSLGGALNWLCNFLIAIGYPPFEMAVGPYSFIPFIFVITVFGVFFFFKLPETKNKSYTEIYAEMGIEDEEDGDDEEEEDPTMIQLKHNNSSLTSPEGQALMRNGGASETEFADIRTNPNV